jgi:Arc/MetJ-type ribon-helix-helix transcriptional regulator
MAIPRRTIKVPVEIVSEIDKFISKSKGFFRSRPEVAIAALEKFLKIKRKK